MHDGRAIGTIDALEKGKAIGVEIEIEIEVVVCVECDYR